MTLKDYPPVKFESRHINEETTTMVQFYVHLTGLFMLLYVISENWINFENFKNTATNDHKTFDS